MGALAQAGDNPAGQNFLVWVADVGGIPLLVAMIAANVFMIWFMRWIFRWSQTLAAAEFKMTRSDLIRGIIVGVALATLWLFADFLKLWQQQVPFWGRQAWETRIIMMGMLLLLGATGGTTVFQIRRFKRTLAEHCR